MSFPDKCDRCGRHHYRTDPCKIVGGPPHPESNTRAQAVNLSPLRDVKPGSSARKSIAARMDVPVQLASSDCLEDRGLVAGTQALPIDTTTSRVSEPPKAYSNSKPKFDKRDYQRIYVARWRRGEVGKKHSNKSNGESNA